MMNVGSLSTSGNVVFNLDTQVGITHLLASIRLSEINSEYKSELRDLVFLYTNGGKDQTVRLALEQKIATYQLAPAPQKVTAPVLPPPPTIGTYRPAPSFNTSFPNTTPVQPVAVASNFTAAPAWQPAPVVAPVSPPAPPIPVAEVVVPPEPVFDPAPVTPPPAPAPIPVAPATPVIASDDPQYLKRIREIKALVNEKVGNPVNLVDINNEVGREYMGALLDAMKKLNSGSSAASAMQRLEEAYLSVEEALKHHEKNIAAPTPVLEVAPEAVRVAPVPEAVRIVPIPASANVSPIVEAPKVAVSTPIALKSPVPEEAIIIEDEPLPKTGTFYTETGAFPAVQKAPVRESISAWTPQPEIMPAAPTGHFSSLAESKDKPHTLSDVPSSLPLKTTSVAGDPLFSAEVDAGLQQLLLEWPIFKKSGLFGAGPKGHEHPLFKKMSPLQIPLLLAGRFEGATQDIKQSVTDYMNGWRYEQGLIYQQAETFEHYLRRVIRHILDLQKGK